MFMTEKKGQDVARTASAYRRDNQNLLTRNPGQVTRYGGDLIRRGV